MKKIFTVLISLVFFFLFSFSVARGVEAAFLKFDRAQMTLNANELFDLQVIVDAENDQVQSADIYVIYDTNQFEVQSVSESTSYFGDVTVEKLAGKIYIAGLPEEQGKYETGSGTVATIKLKALKSGSITFDCPTSGVYKNDPNVPNVLNCSKNESVKITLAGDTSSSSSSSSSSGYNQPTPSTLPQTGFFDNTLRVAAGGIILVLIGGLFQFIL